MKSFKEWIGKSLLLRLEHGNAKYKELEARYVMVKRICQHGHGSSFRDRVKLIEMIENNFEVYEGEVMATIENANDEDIIWHSLSVNNQSMQKSYEFKVVNNARILHGRYIVENYTSANMDEIGYYNATFENNVLISDTSRGPIWDTVDQSKPFFPGCEMVNIVK